RKNAVLVFILAAAIVCIPLGTMILERSSIMMLVVVIFAFVVSTASGPIPAFFSERFPTEVRNSAAGFSYNAGLIFGSWSPLIAIHLMSSVDKSMVPVAFGVNIIIGAVICAVPTILSRETKEVEL
ncbi:MAG: MFS transporter, partial [Candidatus Nitrosotenuis sp.]|nr:MFS transporter [Candidatus Nitrosotenuis sp.]